MKTIKIEAPKHAYRGKWKERIENKYCCACIYFKFFDGDAGCDKHKMLFKEGKTTDTECDEFILDDDLCF